MVFTATERKCLACRKKDADTEVNAPALCFGCLNRAGDIEELQINEEVICEIDTTIRGRLVRVDMAENLVVVATKHRHEIIPLNHAIVIR